MPRFVPAQMIIFTMFNLPGGEMFYTKTEYSTYGKGGYHEIEKLCTSESFAKAAMTGSGRCETKNIQPQAIPNKIWLALLGAHPRYHPVAAAIIEKYGPEREKMREQPAS